MTIEQILDDLFAVTYSDSSYTIERRFFVHEDENFEDFEDFPLIVVETGEEEVESQANLVSSVIFYPVIHLFDEGKTAEQMETWRDAIRNAIYNDATLRSHVWDLAVTAITPNESKTRKLQHLKFDIMVKFDIIHT